MYAGFGGRINAELSGHQQPNQRFDNVNVEVRSSFKTKAGAFHVSRSLSV